VLPSLMSSEVIHLSGFEITLRAVKAVRVRIVHPPLMRLEVTLPMGSVIALLTVEAIRPMRSFVYPQVYIATKGLATAFVIACDTAVRVQVIMRTLSTRTSRRVGSGNRDSAGDFRASIRQDLLTRSSSSRTGRRVGSGNRGRSGARIGRDLVGKIIISEFAVPVL
jgi:hypothetical protein